MRIKDCQTEIHNTAKEKGFWDTERNIGELIALCHSELSEALEEYRGGNHPTYIWYQGYIRPGLEVRGVNVIIPGIIDGPIKPMGFPIELADLIIRVLDMAEGLGIDLEEAIRLQMAYNKTREQMHGKKF